MFRRVPGRAALGAVRRMFAPGLAALIAFAASGCATKGDIRELRASVLAAQMRQDSVAMELQRQNRALMDSLAAVSELLLRVRGELGHELVEVQEQLIQIQELTGQSQRRLAALREEVERRSLRTEAPPDTGAEGGPAQTGGEAAELYRIGMGHMEQGAPQTARMAFEQIVGRHSRHERAPDAQFQLAETYAQEGRYERALEAFERVLELFPNSDRAPNALYRQGVIAEDRGNIQRAREYFQRVIRGYPDSDAAQQARDRLDRLGS